MTAREEKDKLGKLREGVVENSIGYRTHGTEATGLAAVFEDRQTGIAGMDETVTDLRRLVQQVEELAAGYNEDRARTGAFYSAILRSGSVMKGFVDTAEEIADGTDSDEARAMATQLDAANDTALGLESTVMIGDGHAAQLGMFALAAATDLKSAISHLSQLGDLLGKTQTSFTDAASQSGEVADQLRDSIPSIDDYNKVV